MYKLKYSDENYVVLNPIDELSHIEEDEIAVGVRNFRLLGQPCLMELEHDGYVWNRKCTDIIPRDLTGQICSVQVYKKN